MTKKLLSLTLALLFVLTLTACVVIPDNNAADDDKGQAGGSFSDTNNNNDTTDSSEADNDTKDSATSDNNSTVAFEEVVLVDNDVCTVKITGIDSDNFWGYTLKAYLENKTDKNLTFSLRDVSVNGFMCNPLFAASVTAGMKANENISISDSDLEANGITSVTDIEFNMVVYDSDDYAADHFLDEVYTVYPMGKDAVQPYVRTPQEGEVVLFDNEYCTMIVTGFDPDSMWGYAMNVYLENKTDKTLMFTVDDASVNGFMCDPFWADTVAPGKRSNTRVTWMEKTLEDNNIQTVESLTLPIRVYDENDWMADKLVDDTFTVTP